VRRWGYACVRVGTNEPTVRTCRLSNASPERLSELVVGNLDRLEATLRWNHQRGIDFFRIHSNTVPFASHPDVEYDWEAEHGDRLAEIGRLLDRAGTRVSMHPGPYTVPNSPDPDVRESARAELVYHARCLDALDTGPEAKIVLHVGGVYDDREAAKRRFVETVDQLPDRVRRRLVVENDEERFDASEVLDLAHDAGIPALLDHLHHRLNPVEPSFATWIRRAAETWTDQDGVPIVHLSSASGRSGGHHADRVDPGDARDLLASLEGVGPVDVMLEAKDKERALLELRDALGVEEATS